MCSTASRSPWPLQGNHCPTVNVDAVLGSIFTSRDISLPSPALGDSVLLLSYSMQSRCTLIWKKVGWDCLPFGQYLLSVSTSTFSSQSILPNCNGRCSAAMLNQPYFSPMNPIFTYSLKQIKCSSHADVTSSLSRMLSRCLEEGSGPLLRQ